MSSHEDASVLVVDDEHDLADMYAQLLADAYDVDVAYDGHEALDAVDDSTDVVLLDRRMPGLSGDEVLRTIRDREYDCGVIMVTAVDPDFDIFGLEFDEYLCKPITRDDLRGVIERVLTAREYDPVFREYLTVTAKLTLLEVEKPAAELDDSEVYADLTARADDLETKLREQRDDAEDVIDWLRGGEDHLAFRGG